MGVDLSGYSDAEIDQAFEEVPVLWVLKNNLKNETGFPIEFEKRRWQIDMWNDLSSKQVVLKPPQIGETIKNLIKSFFVAKKLKKDIIYTLPTEDDVRDMAGGKINRIVAQNPIFRDWIKDHDSVEQKKVGDNIIYYRGTFTSKAAMMVSSSLNMHDEIDASNADVITQYETRLEAQEREEDKWRWYFSHPSIAGHGVDIYWQQSDKKEWVITCDDCKKRQILSWPDSIDKERECYQCKSCKKALTDDERIYGEWLPTAQGEFSGYHVSQLMLHNKTAHDILASFNDPKKDEQFFFNYVLGLPYVGSENKITSDVVLKNCVPEVNEQNDRIIIGVDTGLPIHYTCMNKQGVFYFNTCTDYDELEKLLIRWPSSIIVADQGGDLIGIRKLQEKYPGRVFLVYYRKDRKTGEMINWQDDGTVVVDRNRMFQIMVEQLRDLGRIRLNGKVEEWQPWADHFNNVYRELKVAINKPGKDVATNYGAELIWKRNGPDHFTHTLLYALVGMDRFATESATFIKKGKGVMDSIPRAIDNQGIITGQSVFNRKPQGYVEF